MGSKNKRKQPKIISDESKSQKNPVVKENPEAYFTKTPKWSFKYFDSEHERWGFAAFSNNIKDILETFKARERMTWNDIFSQSGGRAKGTNNHFITIDKFIPEAQVRLNEIKRDTDSLFSLRVNGKFRIWGEIFEGIFSVIWIDTEHEICPSNRKHT